MCGYMYGYDTGHPPPERLQCVAHKTVTLRHGLGIHGDFLRRVQGFGFRVQSPDLSFHVPGALHHVVLHPAILPCPPHLPPVVPPSPLPPQRTCSTSPQLLSACGLLGCRRTASAYFSEASDRHLRASARVAAADEVAEAPEPLASWEGPPAWEAAATAAAAAAEAAEETAAAPVDAWGRPLPTGTAETAAGEATCCCCCCCWAAAVAFSTRARSLSATPQLYSEAWEGGHAATAAS